MRRLAAITVLAVTAALAGCTSAHAAPEPTPWQHVTAYCHRTGVCVRTPAVIRRAERIGPHVPSWTRFGDTTYTWVRGPHGTVTTYTS
jgi:nitrous oxide reductase accessory protein NosL